MSLVPYESCEKLKKILLESNFIDTNGVSNENNIFIGNHKIESPPNIFITITPNGYISDYGDIYNQTIILSLNTQLIGGMPNTKKIKYIIDKLILILSIPQFKDDYWFSILKNYTVGQNINLINGYSTTLINIHVKNF